MRKICVIYNPAARSGRSARVVRELTLEQKGCALWATQSPRDAERLACRAAQGQFDVVVAAGGDGTLNEVVNGLMMAPDASRPALGFLPLGTVNVFAREIGIPLSPHAAWEIIERGHSHPVDLLRANEFWFIQMAGVGLDAQIAARTSLKLKSKLGFFAYVAQGFKELRAPLPRLIARSESVAAEGSIVLVGNGRKYASWFNMWPRARLDNGSFDVCVWQGNGIGSALWFAWRALSGRHVREPNVKYFSATTLTVESLDAPAPFEVDGEVVGQTPLEFSVRPRALRVIFP